MLKIVKSGVSHSQQLYKKRTINLIYRSFLTIYEKARSSLLIAHCLFFPSLKNLLPEDESCHDNKQDCYNNQSDDACFE